MDKRLAFLIVVAAILVAGGTSYLVMHHDSNSAPQQPVTSVSAYNQTKQAAASNVPAEAQDKIQFTLSAENPSGQTIKNYVFALDINSIVPVAALTDAGGSSFNATNNSLVWPQVTIPAHSSAQKQFTIEVNQYADNGTNPVISLTFNNALKISLTNSALAAINSVTKAANPATPKKFSAPVTGANENLALELAGMAILFTAAFQVGLKLRTSGKL